MAEGGIPEKQCFFVVRKGENRIDNRYSSPQNFISAELCSKHLYNCFQRCIRPQSFSTAIFYTGNSHKNARNVAFFLAVETPSNVFFFKWKKLSAFLHYHNFSTWNRYISKMLLSKYSIYTCLLAPAPHISEFRDWMKNYCVWIEAQSKLMTIDPISKWSICFYESDSNIILNLH